MAKVTWTGNRRQANVLASLVKEKMDTLEEVLRRDSGSTPPVKRDAAKMYAELEELYRSFE